MQVQQIISFKNDTSIIFKYIIQEFFAKTGLSLSCLTGFVVKTWQMFLQDVAASICFTDILSSHPFDIEAALVQLVEKVLMSILAIGVLPNG